MRALVVFYSLSGTTRRVAQTLAAELGADLEEIRCSRYRPGFFGFWRAGYASWRSKIPEIVPPTRDPGDYELVAVGGPVCKNRSKPAPDFSRKRQVISAHSGR